MRQLLGHCDPTCPGLPATYHHICQHTCSCKRPVPTWHLSGKPSGCHNLAQCHCATSDGTRLLQCTVATQWAAVSTVLLWHRMHSSADEPAAGLETARLPPSGAESHLYKRIAPAAVRCGTAQCCISKLPAVHSCTAHITATCRANCRPRHAACSLCKAAANSRGAAVCQTWAEAVGT